MVVFENPKTQVVITAVGPDNIGLADPIIHHVTASGANICEIQMFNRDSERSFAMFLRADWPGSKSEISEIRHELKKIGDAKQLEIRAWPLIITDQPARIALCCTNLEATPRSVLEAVKSGALDAEVPVMISNRRTCESLAKEYEVPFECIGDESGRPDNHKFLELLDRYQSDYVVLARYMRMVPENICWSYAGGRIINLHHGILPAYPGPKPYSDAYAHNVLSYGATAHFIIPELDAGNQIINQRSFSVEPSTDLSEIVKRGQTQNEPQCLVEALQKVIDGTVALHFHKVVKISNLHD